MLRFFTLEKNNFWSGTWANSAVIPLIMIKLLQVEIFFKRLLDV